ncbi:MULTISPECIES: hypothetical protein [Enterococcus]|uniref:DUF5640 domain-containing protein n=1 Tax=Enterococcus sulfureus ATCC 49903 TaxID=1140003 RepID=S0NQ86_9ENTE|nr:hypothetical protein [Enterococcus sulfureus]EOT45543.1 hypothetical protein OMY_02122 [Enterococcus sulfureus ATCC 49903]EOT83434.1 hypothetical protein I573_01984 [Enterococcus sulfureus ATCC 49903]
MRSIKWGLIIVVLCGLSGCAKANPSSTTSNTTITNQTSTTSKSSTSESTNKIQSSTLDSKVESSTQASMTQSTESTDNLATSEPQLVQTLPIGTWSNEANTLTIDSDGSWHFTGEITSSGTLSVAAATPNMWLLKLYGFNNSIDNIGTYQLAALNQDGSKMNFGYLGLFDRIDNATAVFDPSLYQPDYLQTPTDFTQSLIGTWSTKNKAYDFQTTYNFNPDGTFERFGDGKGIADRGTFTSTQDQDQLTLTLNVNGTDQTLTYRFVNGELIDPEFEWASLIRNTVPTKP